ncbi:MAG: ABC transporter substrate-binding protein, partial [Acetobacteraceae bacterium]
SHVASVLTMSGIGDYYGQLKREGHLAEYTPEAAAKLSPKVASTIDPGYVYPVGGGLMAIAYNSKIVAPADVPRSWDDLTNPKWKGKLALSHPAFSGFDAALDVWLMRTKGWSFFQALAKNNPLIQRSTFETITALNSGESSVGTMPDEVAIESARKGNPVRVVYPTDGSVLILGFTAILKDAPQPNTARLFTEFLLGTEHAKIMAANHYVPVRPEVSMTLQGSRDLNTIAMVPLRPSEQFAKDLATLIERWRDLFGS